MTSTSAQSQARRELAVRPRCSGVNLVCVCVCVHMWDVSEAVGSKTWNTCILTSAVSLARLQSQVHRSQTPSLGRERNTTTESHQSFVTSDTDCCVVTDLEYRDRGR